MDKDNEEINNKPNHVSGIVHVVLSQDYAVFFLAVVLGAISDAVFSFGKFSGEIYQDIGLFLIIAGTAIIYWAQTTTKNSKKNIQTERDTNFFIRGPYRYTRNPTNFGLTIATLGLGFIIGSLFAIIFIVIAYFISKFIFIKKQDSILEERYGNVFVEYKKRVKNWL